MTAEPMGPQLLPSAKVQQTVIRVLRAWPVMLSCLAFLATAMYAKARIDDIPLIRLQAANTAESVAALVQRTATIEERYQRLDGRLTKRTDANMDAMDKLNSVLRDMNSNLGEIRGAMGMSRHASVGIPITKPLMLGLPLDAGN